MKLDTGVVEISLPPGSLTLAIAKHSNVSEYYSETFETLSEAVAAFAAAVSEETSSCLAAAKRQEAHAAKLAARWK